jgi:hypothetical protein
MSLREQAAADLRTITEDVDGFGWSITVISSEGLEAQLTGLSTDIGLMIDPDTGAAISGRRASVAIAIATLTAAGLSMPKAVSDKTQKPWQVRFADIAGAPHTFKVQEVMPDRAAGIVVCFLEAYRTS